MNNDGSCHHCLVCSVPIKSAHLGMEICRACAQFFKRSKLNSRQYECRTGDFNCTTSTDGKFSCALCRYEKCKEIGLEYDGPLRLRRKPTVPILERIETELKASFKRRLVEEMKVIKIHGGHQILAHPTEELYVMHQDTCFEIYRISIIEAYEFFRNVFPAFLKLKNREHETIFKDYVGKMNLVEGYHRTRQLWGGAKNYMMISLATCYDFDYEVKHEEIKKVENANLLISTAKASAEEQNEVFLPIYNKSSITEREYYALLALVMSELDSSCDISEEAQVMLDEYRQEVLEDLQSHYQNDLGLKDYSIRLGNLMTINHTIQECKSLFKVFFSFYVTLF
ncbi:hypothetical protein PENTCL1PPCAC_17107, partial [Pristionchus entomophagus]